MSSYDIPLVKSDILELDGKAFDTDAIDGGFYFIKSDNLISIERMPNYKDMRIIFRENTVRHTLICSNDFSHLLYSFLMHGKDF